MSRSYTDSLDFTHLEGETEDNADFDSLANYANETAVVQPNLAIPPPPRVSRNRRRSERDQDEHPSSEAAVLPNNTQGEVNHNVAKSSSEGFEDSFVNGPSVSSSSTSPSSQREENGINNEASSPTASDTTEANGPTDPSSSYKIHYDCTGGNVSVLDGQMTRRPDGTQYINTHGIHDQWEEQYNQPLRKKRIRLIKIFSIVACFFFFPSGIPAVYFAFRTEKEFEEGILRGNIDRAQKFAKRSERLIVLSFVMAFIVGALTVALIERPYFEARDYHRGTISG